MGMNEWIGPSPCARLTERSGEDQSKRGVGPCDWVAVQCAPEELSPDVAELGGEAVSGLPARCLDQFQVMLIARSKLTYPARWKAFAMGVLLRSVDARMRGTFSSARTRVPSARISSM
jgi:hypothetical protein